MANATDSAWPLAQSIYATPSLRPYLLDEMHARVLCGEPPPVGSPPDLHDLAETVAAVHGEDAPSRAVLADMARRLKVRALVVVHMGDTKPVARVFLADVQAFDAATYGPDADISAENGGPRWGAATQSLVRAFGGATTTVASAGLAAPQLATHEGPGDAQSPQKSKAFYESGWFWGAVGAAAFAGGALFFATRDTGPTSIHLDMQVPH